MKQQDQLQPCKSLAEALSQPMPMDTVQHAEQEQFPHFFSWLNSRQHKTKRPASAMHRPHSSTTQGSNKGLTTANNALQQQQHQQHRRSASPSAGAAVGRTSCSGSLIGSRPASAVKPRRPVSAAPNLAVAAQRLSADSTLSAQAPTTRPFSASHAVRMAQQQQRQSSTWQQQQRTGLQQSFAVCVQGHRPLSAGTQPGSIHQHRMQSADLRLQQQHQWQPQGPTRPGSALVLAKQHRTAPACLLPRAGSAVAASLAPPWLQAHTAAAAAATHTHGPHPLSGPAAATAAAAAACYNSSGCSCSDGMAAPAAAAGCSRPCSALVQAGSRLSRPSSPSSVRPGSRAGPGNGVGSAWTAGGSPWAAFGADAPLVWQRVSSADTQRYLQQQQEALAQQQHQPQQPQQQQGGAGQEHPAAEQGEGLHEQDSQQAEDPDSWQGTGVSLQQQQQCCHHQAALQLFRQLPLSGAAAHASVTREVLQQMALGLQIELQGVGAPLELELPAALGQDSSGGGEQEEAGVAMRQGVPGHWSARQQVARELHVWQKLTAELLRQTHLECSERGQLLQAAVDRQQQLLQQALTACDDVYQGLIASAATQQQQQEAMLSARADVQTLQQENMRLKALLEAKQAKLVSTAVELDEQRERMRRGRFHLIHEQVQEARMEVEKRVLRDLESHVHKARTAVQEAASARQQVLLDAVEDLAGHEVVEAVLRKLQEHEEAVLQQRQQREQGQERQEQGQDGQEEDSVAAQSGGS